MAECSEQKLRLFVAVPAPEAVKSAAGAIIEKLRGPGEVRWVEPELMHLTLKFLGSTPAEKMPSIEKELEKTSNNYSAFVVNLSSVGAFPSLRKPQTLWLGIEGDVLHLAALAEGVEASLAPLGFPPEGRAFRAHLTIGRVKGPRGLGELARRLAQVKAEDDGRPPIAWPVREFHLVRSDLSPTGPHYTSLHEYPLAGAR